MTEIIINWSIVIISAYLLGSLSGALVISKLFFKMDIRTKGSGNAGMTNTLRILGKKAAIFVSLIDVLKSVGAMVIADLLLGQIGVIPATLALLLGHAYPCFFGFRGGKGIICGAMAVLFYDWRVFVTVIAVFVIFLLIYKVVAVGSIAAAAALPLSLIVYGAPGAVYYIFYTLVAAFVIFLHRKNIIKIIRSMKVSRYLKRKLQNRGASK